MAAQRTYRTTRYASDHFEPETDLDPQAQRRLRGLLERIDYTAFACNSEILGKVLGHASEDSFRRLAVAAATARAQWAAEALAVAERGPPQPIQAKRLAELREAYQELSEAYEGLRRMIERGYLTLAG